MMFIFPNCVIIVSIQALSDSVKFSRRLMQKILDLLSCDLTTSKDQSYRAEFDDINKIGNKRQVNNCDLRIDRDMCTIVIMYSHVYISPSTLIFENFRGGGGAPPL